ncbi:MAG: hypothetical protein JOY70_00075 [Acidisphaera sp.]|nr:hypothetical protein [Acidisphaera sp.]
MLCDGCGETMGRETIVLVSRLRGRTRSVSQPGWFCWTCQVSVHTACDMLDPPPSRPRRTRVAEARRSETAGGRGAA